MYTYYKFSVLLKFLPTFISPSSIFLFNYSDGVHFVFNFFKISSFIYISLSIFYDLMWISFLIFDVRFFNGKISVSSHALIWNLNLKIEPSPGFD